MAGNRASQANVADARPAPSPCRNSPHVRQQPLDVRARMHQPAFAGALRGGPAGIEPVGDVTASKPTSRRSSAISPTASMASGAIAPV